jgi:hypothetical protein
MNTPQSPSWMISRHPGTIYSNFFVNIWSIPVGFRPILGGGGDKGDLVERSTRPKPPGEAIAIGFSRVDRMGSTKREITSAAVEEAQRFVAGKPREDADDAQGRSGPSDGQSYLLVNIQQQMGLTKKMRVSLNLILMMRKQGASAKVMAIAVFYSQKSYNPSVLFTDMLNAWGIPNLALAEKLSDYIFKLEFHKEADKEWCMVAHGGIRETPSLLCTTMG